MEGVGAASSVIAVIELSAKVASLCLEYFRAVKKARDDIIRLQREINHLNDVLVEVTQLLDGPNGGKLSASQKLFEALKECCSQLQRLNNKLEPSKGRKAMRRMGIRALKWPFESKEIDAATKKLERYKQTVSLALQVDQTTHILGINEKINLSKLNAVQGAAFDSYDNELDARCHPNTRVELLCQIRQWARDLQGKSIFWLNGMAGTGKSTISRTFAQSLADEGQLGASFFFKRGEGDRGNASRFFSTIVSQLMFKIPALKPYVSNTINTDPAIAGKTIKEQFEKLILEPLSAINTTPTLVLRLVIVVDALDECEKEDHIRNILYLFSQLQASIKMSFRIFVTSRPELPVRLGFKNMSGDAYQDLVLHEMPPPTIEHDISVFLQHELAKVRNNCSLSLNWPNENDLQALVRMAIPLFIFAATVCRFIGQKGRNPIKQLKKVLEYQTYSQVSKLAGTYRPILDELLIDHNDSEQAEMIGEFREIIGSIIILAEPLSTINLASLLQVPKYDIICQIELLHSVLSIPTKEESPIQLLHLSFREFLLDIEMRGKSPFWIDGGERHAMLSKKCLELMSRYLKENICNLGTPGKLRTAIDSQVIDNCLPTDLRYACRYWIYHLEQSKSRIDDNGPVYNFLQQYFLNWLEALSLVGKMSESVAMIDNLETLVSVGSSPQAMNFIRDAKRFVLKNRWIIDTAPLQIYSSGLIFTPEASIIKTKFKDRIPRWIQGLPKVDTTWSALLQTLEGHTNSVSSVAFSHDSQQLASGSGDETVRLWDAATGMLLQTLEGHTGPVRSVAFSHNGQQLASGSSDGTVWLWDAVTGAPLQMLEGHMDWVNSVAFSHNDQQLASGSRDETVRLWDTATGMLLQTLEGHTSWVNSVAFFSNSQKLASGSGDKTVRLWDVETGILLQILEGHTSWVRSVAFSHNSWQLASGSEDRTVRLWDVATGMLLQTLEGHTDSVSSVAFSHDSRQLASGSGDETVRLWDTTTGMLLQILEGHTSWVRSVAFSYNSWQLVSGSEDRTVRLWDVATDMPLQTLEGHTGPVNSVAFSHNSQQLASGSSDRTVQLWDTATGMLLQTLEGHTDSVNSVAFSCNSQQLASGCCDKTVWLWDTAAGTPVQMLGDYMNSISLTSQDFDLLTDSKDSSYRIETQQKWITWNGSNVLWLPPEYRPSESAVMRYAIGVGCRSGVIYILNFRPGVLPYV